MAAKPKKPKKPIASLKAIRRYHELIAEHGFGFWLSKRRVNPCTLAKEIEEHLKATSVKVFHHQGEVVYSDPMVDWNARFRALELAVRAWGLMPAEKREVTGPDGGPIQSESQLVIQAGPGLSGLVERLVSSGIAGPGPEDGE